MNHKTDAINWKQFIIKCKVEESSNVYSFYLTPLKAGMVTLHKPGQYVPIRIYSNKSNEYFSGNFSISSAPNEDYYRITVASTTSNQLENYLIAYVEEGFVVEVGDPVGSFVLRDNNHNKVFIADSLGQAPLLSMLETLDLKETLSEKIIWISQLDSLENQAFRTKINYIKDNCSALQTHVFCNSLENGNADSHIYEGTVDLNKIKGWELDSSADYYVCGSSLFTQKLQRFLNKQDIKTSQLYVENTTTSLN